MATPSSRPIGDPTTPGKLKRIDAEIAQIKREMVKQQKIPPPAAGGSFAVETAHVTSNNGPFWHAGKAYMALGESNYSINNAIYGEDPPSWIRTSLDRIILEPGYYTWQMQLQLEWATDAGCPPSIKVYDGSPLAWTVQTYARTPLAGGRYGYNLYVNQPIQPIDELFDWLRAEAELLSGDYTAVTEVSLCGLQWIIARLG